MPKYAYNRSNPHDIEPRGTWRMLSARNFDSLLEKIGKSLFGGGKLSGEFDSLEIIDSSELPMSTPPMSYFKVRFTSTSGGSYVYNIFVTTVDSIVDSGGIGDA
jgi:hypothetical protein